MKKLLQMLGILLILFIVSACQANTEPEVDDHADSGQNTAEESESDESSEASEASEEESAEEQNNKEGTSANQDTDTSYEYEEQEVIAEQIAEGEYDIVVETDNQGTRVMFYEIDGEKYYKTIFVKNDKRLKIIDIKNNNGQIYNEII
ncbi:hypothetical protein [Oceanobacillus sp. CFH 90083]|uniref:hypothetical protein n=1 Tax=Oceanobacillus sp. CFH 90083 TaxID=2592336 RepID=UPI00128D3F02|nr:hypothetical protein [Oceanobacillus sp. CFH 90083]